MSADKIKKIDHEIKEIHTHIKQANLGLRQRIKEIQQSMPEWDFVNLDEHKNGDRGFTDKF
ncbi:MAG: hypothetical protein ACREBR_04420 [bacterium]